MNFEQFPTSETAKKMLSYITGNGFYDNSYVGKWIFQVMGEEMGDARAIIDELPLQAFVETATWGLRYHEEKYGLPIRENLSPDERRKIILEKRDLKAPMSPWRMEKIINEIRPLMKRVAVLAEKYHCAIILIGHMNKNSNGKSSYRGLGSIDFQAAARSVLIVGRIKDEPEIRVVCHVKSSLAPEGKSIAFRLDKDTGFEWIGEYDISADDLLSGDNRGQKIHVAKEFLQEFLVSGSVAQTKVAEEAEVRGIKKKTLWNAKKELEIDSVKIGNQWFWMLPE